MSDVLDVLLDIFACDRAWLIYPCDPQAPSWRVVMERTRPPFPDALAVNADVPTDAHMSALFAAAQASSVPVLSPAAGEVAQRFAIRSRMATAVHPKVDQPYLFGLHQCSYERIWTEPEKRLFQEVGSRLADALTSLLMFRSLQQSERKLEAAQRIARVGWWERDFRTNRVSLSDEVRRTFAVDPVELPHWHERWVNVIHPEDRPKTAAAAAAALNGGPPYDVEYRVVRPDGSVRVVHSQGEVIRDESGRPVRQFGIAARHHRPAAGGARAARERGALPHARPILLRRVLGDRRTASLYPAGVHGRSRRRTRTGVGDRQDTLGSALSRAGRGGLAQASRDARRTPAVPRFRDRAACSRRWQALCVRVGTTDVRCNRTLHRLPRRRATYHRAQARRAGAAEGPPATGPHEPRDDHRRADHVDRPRSQPAAGIDPGQRGPVPALAEGAAARPAKCPRCARAHRERRRAGEPGDQPHPRAGQARAGPPRAGRCQPGDLGGDRRSRATRCTATTWRCTASLPPT